MIVQENQEKKSRILTRDPIVAIQHRQWTDVVCLITFISLVSVIMIISIYAWSTGNFKKLTTAYDPDGKGCGIDYPEYPYIYFASPHTDSLWVTVCVSKCPVTTDTVLACKTNSVVKTCTAVKDINNTKSLMYPTLKEAANTACLPTSDKIKNEVAAAFGASANGMSSLVKNFGLILLSLPIAIIVSMAFMIVIRCAAKLFIYLLIIFAVVFLMGMGAYMLATPGNSSTIMVACVCFFFGVIILLAVFCIRRRLALAAIIIKVSAKFVSQNCLIVLLPITIFLITVLYLGLWILQGLGFYSLGSPTTTEHQYPFQHFEVTGSIQFLFGVHILHLIWVLLFFIQTSNFIIGGSAVNWYYKREKPYAEASERYRKKHVGSVCFGSFMLALLGIVRMIYNILVPKQQSQGIMKIFKRCCDFLCILCTKLFEWFTTGAFTISNIRGTNYCESGAQAFRLRFASLNTSTVVALVQSIFNLLVSLGITSTTVFVIDLLIKYVSAFKTNVQDSSLILLIVAFEAFTISCFFISVYADAIDAIYMSYLVDRERGESDYPPELKEFLLEAEKEK